MSGAPLVPADMDKVIKKLEDVSENFLGVHPRVSKSSLNERDSGLSSRSISSSSLDHPQDNFAPMEVISEVLSSPGSSKRRKRPTLTRESRFEDTDRPLSPTINVEEAASDESTESKQAEKPPACHLLSLLLPPRKGSSDSTTSEEYVTPPTSRKLSIGSSASSSSSPQDIRIKVQINLPNSKGENQMVLNSSAKVSRNLKQLQLNIFLTPNASKHSPTLRKSSSDSKPSTPNSPTPREKMLNFPSKSLDGKSLLRSPCMVTKHDKTKRRSRNNLIAHIVRRNMVEFVDSTDMDSLCPHLFAKEVLSRKDMEDLEGIRSTRGKKNFFYMLLLDSKGVSAYQKLFECLESEKDHCGHRDLVKIINDELEKEHLK